MAWESRIASESRRRVVLAAISLALLAISAALAMWMTLARRQTYDSTMPTSRLGDFEFSVPGNWYAASPDTGDSGSMTFQSQRTLLSAVQLSGDGWRAPLQAIREASTRLIPTMPSSENQTLSYGPVSVLLSSAQSQEPTREGVVTQRNVLAVATVDGQSYVAFFLRGQGPLRESDVDVTSQVALSLMDSRYEEIDGEIVELNNARIKLPDSLLAMRSVQSGSADNASLLIAPNSSRYFYRMHLSVVKTEQLRRQWEQQGIDQAKTAPVRKLIEAQLKARYLTINGIRPPNEALRSFDLGTRTVQIIVLDDVRLRGSQREWWASELDDQHVLLLELLVDIRAINVANQQAELIVRTVQMTPTDAALDAAKPTNPTPTEPTTP